MTYLSCRDIPIKIASFYFPDAQTIRQADVANLSSCTKSSSRIRSCFYPYNTLYNTTENISDYKISADFAKTYNFSAIQLGQRRNIRVKSSSKLILKQSNSNTLLKVGTRLFDVSYTSQRFSQLVLSLIRNDRITSGCSTL